MPFSLFSRHKIRIYFRPKEVETYSHIHSSKPYCELKLYSISANLRRARLDRIGSRGHKDSVHGQFCKVLQVFVVEVWLWYVLRAGEG